MTRHILCAVDLTHDSDARAILTEAGRIADRDGAGLSVVTVLPDYGTSWVGSFFQDGTLKEAAQAAQAALREMVAKVLPERSAVQHIVEIGTAYVKVLEAGKLCNADLIIVGAHKPDFEDKVLGPNAARIVRLADVSVLVLRL